jgi:hypothetical protein
LANIASEGASKTEQRKESDTSKEISEQILDTALQSNSMIQALSGEQRDMLTLLVQNQVRKTTEMNLTGEKRKRETSSLDFDLSAPPSNDDLQFMLSNLAKQLGDNGGE